MNELKDLTHQFSLKFFVKKMVLWLRLTWVFDRTVPRKRTWAWTFTPIRGWRWIETKSLLKIDFHCALSLSFYLWPLFGFHYLCLSFQVDFAIFVDIISDLRKSQKNTKKDENRKNQKSLNPALDCPKLLPRISIINTGLDFLFRFKNHNYSVIITHWLLSWSALMSFYSSNEGLNGL